MNQPFQDNQPFGPSPNADLHGRPPGFVAPTSGLAIASLSCAIAGTMCVGPIGSIPAVILGIAALWEIRNARGQKGGSAVAGIGVGLGAFVTVAYGAIIALAVVGAYRTKPPSAPFTAPTYAAPTSTPFTPMPRPTTTSDPSMTKDPATRETRVGAFTVVDLGAEVASLEAELRSQKTKAARSGEKLILQTTSMGCRPCLGVAASLSDPKMQKALGGVRLVRVEVHEFATDLESLGIPSEIIPGFYVLGTDLAPTDGITGGEWDDDTADNISAVLNPWVRGKYTHRRDPWKGNGSGSRPRPDGTAL